MNHLYEVWCSRRKGITVGPKFRLLEDARRYVIGHRHEASFAIRNPDGRWELVLSRDHDRHAAMR